MQNSLCQCLFTLELCFQPASELLYKMRKIHPLIFFFSFFFCTSEQLEALEYISLCDVIKTTNPIVITKLLPSVPFLPLSEYKLQQQVANGAKGGAFFGSFQAFRLINCARLLRRSQFEK